MTMTGTTKLHPGMSRKEAVRAFVEMRETLRRVEAENADLHKRIKEATEAAVEWQNAYAMNEVYGPTQLEMLRARVTELEAAQQWRPVTEEWPPCDLKVVISAPGASWAEVASKHYDGDEYVWELENGHAFDFESATVALPLP